MPVITGGIPTGPVLNSLEFYAQAAALQANCAGMACNALAVTVSNGLRLFFGTL